MNLHAELQLGDGATAVAPFGADRPAPARGALCLLRVDGLLEPARFVRLLPEGAPRPAAEPAEFVSEATRAEAERVAGNEEALLRVRAAVRRWFAEEGREALVARFRFSLRRERLTMTVAVAGFVDLRPLRDLLDKKFQTTTSVRARPPRDIAAAIGGVGSCGRPLCCSRGLCGAAAGGGGPAARALPRDPGAAGVCGRLRCCLSFEGAPSAP